MLSFFSDTILIWLEISEISCRAGEDNPNSLRNSMDSQSSQDRGKKKTAPNGAASACRENRLGEQVNNWHFSFHVSRHRSRNAHLSSQS
jgi:hypothetical protein